MFQCSALNPVRISFSNVDHFASAAIQTIDKGFVDLSQNAFDSSISPDISKLSNLMGLYLSDLSLTGEIPIDDMKALTWLQFLTINSAPYLRGPILELLESLKYLKILDIQSSGFTGTIPTSIGENTFLQFL